MLDIMLIILPIFMLIGLGFIAVKTGLVKVEAIPSIANIILYFAIPAVVFNAISKTHFSEVVEPYFLLAYALASLGVIVFGLGLRYFLFRDDLGGSAIRTLGMAIPNSMFIGYPLLILAFPQNPPAVAFVMAVMVENLLTMPLLLILLEVAASHGQGLSGRRIWQLVGLRIIKNPLMIGISAGVLASLLGVQMPQVIDQPLSMLAKTASTLALFLSVPRSRVIASGAIPRVFPVWCWVNWWCSLYWRLFLSGCCRTLTRCCKKP
ncbi:MAG: AEC family transporter [Thiolinea sp.]